MSIVVFYSKSYFPNDIDYLFIVSILFQAKNFLRAFRTIPEASALSLVLTESEEASGRTNLPRLISSWHRFLLHQIHSVWLVHVYTFLLFVLKLVLMKIMITSELSSILTYWLRKRCWPSYCPYQFWFLKWVINQFIYNSMIGDIL